MENVLLYYMEKVCPTEAEIKTGSPITHMVEMFYFCTGMNLNRTAAEEAFFRGTS